MSRRLMVNGLERGSAHLCHQRAYNGARIVYSAHRERTSLLSRSSSMSFLRSIASSSSSTETAPPHLVRFQAASLSYPSTTDDISELQQPLDLQISGPTFGGHALLGRNGSGKSLVGQSIVHRGSSDFVKGGSLELPSNWMSNAVAHVSFNSHKELLQQQKESGTDTMTTYRAISQGGTLNKAAQFLIVRFGLYGLLEREVHTLSTGEIRKVLLIRALSTRPKLLILDNAFDGLDVASREVLKELVQKTIAGFTQDILVQGVDSKATSHTQILLMTHRPEELVEGIQTASWFLPEGGDHSAQNGLLLSESRGDRTGAQLFETAFDAEPESLTVIDWEKSSLPSNSDIQEWWKTKDSNAHEEDILVSLQDFSVQRGEATLLKKLNWKVTRGQRWLIGGGNGAGKSTLSRLLARPDTNLTGMSLYGKVGWLATERHMELAESPNLTKDVLQEMAGATLASALKVAGWLGIDKHWLEVPFNTLSQGQQKMLLISAALASQPDLLVLDEPCQGLDPYNRKLVLALVERVCRSTDIGLIYITHHLEEVLPSVHHVLHLKDQKDVFNGNIEDYNPDELQ